MTARPPEALRLLLAGAVDYAGLYPPASLSMPETLLHYRAHLQSPQAWALGRLVLPAARLGELRGLQDPSPTDRAWDVSIVLGADVDGDLRSVRDLAAATTGFRVASLEAAVPEPSAVAHWAARVGAAAKEMDIPAYVELPLADDPTPAVEAIRTHGLRGKARTGGITARAIPEGVRVLRFMNACFAAGLSFKLTAGLHHAVRGSYPLTYEPGSACAPMHGFLNVLVAAALMADETPVESLGATLDEGDATAFRFDDGGITWRGRRADLAAVRRARARLVSFGSCSFEEPVRELWALGLA